jgi:RNA polymerase sigma-70 factor, ECF subfamily
MLSAAPAHAAPLRARPAVTARWWWLCALTARDGGLTGRDPAAAPTDLGAENAEFEAFFRRHERDVFGYLWRLTGEEQAAYDLSQETFIRAWQRFASIRRYEHPAGWLFRVATNLALKHLRHRRLADSLVTSTLGDEDDAAATPAKSIPSVRADHAERVAEGDQIRSVLLALAPRPRALLILHDVYGLSTEEAARALDMTRGAAKMMLCRAREQFRVRYLRQEDRGAAPPSRSEEGRP